MKISTATPSCQRGAGSAWQGCEAQLTWTCTVAAGLRRARPAQRPLPHFAPAPAPPPPAAKSQVSTNVEVIMLQELGPQPQQGHLGELVPGDRG